MNDVLRLLVKGRWLLLSTVLIGVGAAFAYTVLQPLLYSSTASIYVSVRSGEASTAYEIGQGSGAATAKAKSYVEVVRSEMVLEPVVERLGLSGSAAQLAQSVSVDAPAGGVLLNVSVTRPSKFEAAKIANAIARSMQEQAATTLDPAPAGADAAVTLSTIQPARASAEPTSPNLRVNLAVGLVAGLGVGVGAAFLRAALDTRLRRPRDVIEVTDLPMLGTIGQINDAEREPLVVQSAPHGHAAESFRVLRTNLSFLAADQTNRSFVVTSAMPSEGKSITVVNTGMAFAEAGTRVVIVDADLRRPRLAELMGVEGTAGLTHVLAGQAEIEDVLQQWGENGLSVLPAGAIPPNPSELLASEAMTSLIDELTDRFDLVIIDAPPLLPVTDAAVLSRLTTGAVIVTAANQSRAPQLAAALEALRRVDGRVFGVIMTKIATRDVASSGYDAYYGESAPQERRPRSGRIRPRQKLRRLAATPRTKSAPADAIDASVQPSRGTSSGSSAQLVPGNRHDDDDDADR